MKQTESTGISRRRLLAMAGASAGASLLGGRPLLAANKINPLAMPAIKPGTNTSFDSITQVDAGLLNVGYAEAGPANGPAVILLHGWPYDIYSFVDVEVVDWLQSYGPGYQTRINRILRRVMMEGKKRPGKK